MKVAPSIIACDFSRLNEEIKSIEDGGADILHLDIMDGHFVPNITFGPIVVEGIRKLTSLELDAHLMISEPEKYIKDFVRSGCNMISVHIETLKDPYKIFSYLRENNVKIGIAINPETNVEKIKDFLRYVDFVLVMLVHPGFYGQKMIKETLEKVKQIRGLTDKLIEVDGGINGDNVEDLINLKVDIIVSGAYIFKSNDRKEAIRRLKGYGSN